MQTPSKNEQNQQKKKNMPRTVKLCKALFCCPGLLGTGGTCSTVPLMLMGWSGMPKIASGNCRSRSPAHEHGTSLVSATPPPPPATSCSLVGRLSKKLLKFREKKLKSKDPSPNSSQGNKCPPSDVYNSQAQNLHGCHNQNPVLKWSTQNHVRN